MLLWLHFSPNLRWSVDRIDYNSDTQLIGFYLHFCQIQKDVWKTLMSFRMPHEDLFFLVLFGFFGSGSVSPSASSASSSSTFRLGFFGRPFALALDLAFGSEAQQPEARSSSRASSKWWMVWVRNGKGLDRVSRVQWGPNFFSFVSSIRAREDLKTKQLIKDWKKSVSSDDQLNLVSALEAPKTIHWGICFIKWGTLWDKCFTDRSKWKSKWVNQIIHLMLQS